MGSEIKDNPGHYHARRGALFSVEPDGTVIKRLPNVSISNGLAWSADNKEFYYVDTYKLNVEAYDFDLATGDLSECIPWIARYTRMFCVYRRPRCRKL